MTNYYHPDYYTEKMVDSLKENMGSLGKSIKERFEELENKISQLEKKIDSLKQ